MCRRELCQDLGSEHSRKEQPGIEVLVRGPTLRGGAAVEASVAGVSVDRERGNVEQEC